MSVQKKKKVRILSLDGGGMQGIIPATIVKYAEEYLQEKNQEQPSQIILIFLPDPVQARF